MFMYHSQTETVGEKVDLVKLEDLEILFSSFDEISGLESLQSLQKLTLIDNGLTKISNLQPVTFTLTSLCLCDQNIKIIENLNLPNLTELLLYKNQIKKIENLQLCPKIKKLWLFQNDISSLSGLHALPELEECWVQSNQITNLDGFEYNYFLKNIGLSGNPISDFSELKKIVPLESVEVLSLNDVHFGVCDVANLDGYRNFVMCFLPHIKVLDGVLISKQHQFNAHQLYNKEVKLFNSSLQAVEDEYRKDILDIEIQQQNIDDHSKLLQKEMKTALFELQGLVTESRVRIKKEVKKHENLMDINMKTLKQKLNLILDTNKLNLIENINIRNYENDLVKSLFYTLECLASADAELITLLCDLSDLNINKNPNLAQSRDLDKSSHTLAFQCLGTSSPDFQMIQSIINNDNTSHDSDATTDREKRNSDKSPLKNKSKNTNIINTELVKLIRICSSLTPKPQYLNFKNILDNENNYDFYNENGFFDHSYKGLTSGPLIRTPTPIRVFTVLHIKELKNVLLHGWRSVNESNSTLIFSNDANLVIALHSHNNNNIRNNDESNNNRNNDSKSTNKTNQDNGRGSNEGGNRGNIWGMDGCFANTVVIEEGDIDINMYNSNGNDKNININNESSSIHDRNSNYKSSMGSPLLQKAVDKNLVLLISCYIYTVNDGIDNYDSEKDSDGDKIDEGTIDKNNETLNMKIPLMNEDKEFLIKKVNNQNNYCRYNIHESDSFLYTIPQKNIYDHYGNNNTNTGRNEDKNEFDGQNDNTVVGINIEFACTCLISPENEKIHEKININSDTKGKNNDKKIRNASDINLDGSDHNSSYIKSTDIESYLDLLLLPKREVNRNMDIVQSFDKEVQLAMKEYLGKFVCVCI